MICSPSRWIDAPNDPHYALPLRIDHGEQASIDDADGLSSYLCIRPSGHVDINARVVEKYPHSGLEPDTMLSEIARGFGIVPFKLPVFGHTEFPYRRQSDFEVSREFQSIATGDLLWVNRT
jgi:hypothetical protein